MEKRKNKKEGNVRSVARKIIKRIDALAEKFLDIQKENTIKDDDITLIKMHFIDIVEGIKKINNQRTDELREAIMLRNRFAHGLSNEDFERNLSKIEEVFERIKLYKGVLQKRSNENSPNIAKRRFEKFGPEKFGNEEERMKMVDALADAFNNQIPIQEKTEFSQNSEVLSVTVSDIPDEIKEYISNHDALSESVQTEMLDWTRKVVKDVDKESDSYFREEEHFLVKLQQMDVEAFFKDIDGIESEYKKLASSDKEFDMNWFLRELLSLGNRKNLYRYKKAYYQNVLESIEKSLLHRKSAYKRKLIDEKRKIFLNELYWKIENYKKLKRILSPILADLGYCGLWDLSSNPFDDYGFDILSKYSSLLENEDALMKFAEMLGRQRLTSQGEEKKIIEETVVYSEYIPQSSASGNLVGFEYSNDISRVVPSEFALMDDPDLENLFYKKFVEKQILSYSYTQNYMHRYDEAHAKEVTISKMVDLAGPVIICVDTSGSMQGTPEVIAKVATFALAKTALKQRRKCFLISFSTGIETLDLSDFKKPNALQFLVKFLNKSFNGGTDATPALKESIRQLQTENYKNADVLMISDFVMNYLPQNVEEAIKREQKKGTSFYSLVVGNSYGRQIVRCFDENISYNPYDEVSRQEFHKKIEKIAAAKSKSGL